MNSAFFPRLILIICVMFIVLPPSGYRSFADGTHPGLTPPTTEVVIFPGESINANSIVHTPEILPKPDIYFLADSTGSMTDMITGVQSTAQSIISEIDSRTNDPRYGAGDYKDFPKYANPFNNGAPIPNSDDDGSAALAAIGAWSAQEIPGDNDGPESQLFVFDQIAEGVVNWRSDSTRIVVWFGDAPGHDPVCQGISKLNYDINENSITTKLVNQKIKMIAINVITDTNDYTEALNGDPTLLGGDYAPVCGTEGGNSGQASRIVSATEGVLLSVVDSATIAQVILDGLRSLPVRVSLKDNCNRPILTSLAPTQQTVKSGTDATFTEIISITTGSLEGTYICETWALINDQPMTDVSGMLITATKIIHVPGIKLEPGESTKDLLPGVTHTVTATITADSYGPVRGISVEFMVISGPNIGKRGPGITDTDGHAHFTYGSSSVGKDTILAWADRNGNKLLDSGEISATATVTWDPITITLTPPLDFRDVGTSHTVTASVVNHKSNPIPNLLLDFDIQGVHQAHSEIRTNHGGIAVFTYPYSSTQNITGTDTITAWVDLASDNDRRDDNEPFNTATVTWMPISFTVKGTGQGTDVEAVRTITATVVNSAGHGLNNLMVGFNVIGGNSVPTVISPTVQGKAVFIYTSKAPPLPIAQATANNRSNELAKTTVQTTANATDTITVWVDLNHSRTADDAPKVVFVIDVPSAVTLAAFTLHIEGDKVILDWETAVEIDNAGFNLYRAPAPEGPYLKINNLLIPGQGNGYGDHYTYVDMPPNVGRFYYKLEDMDYYGVSTMHGPIEAGVGVPIDGGQNRLYFPIIQR